MRRNENKQRMQVFSTRYVSCAPRRTPHTFILFFLKQLPMAWVIHGGRLSSVASQRLQFKQGSPKIAANGSAACQLPVPLHSLSPTRV